MRPGSPALLVLVLSACAQTDLVAREAPCTGDACDASIDAAAVPDAGLDASVISCPGQLCQSLDTQSSYCAQTSSGARVGDSCSADDTSLPVSRHGLCSCSDLVSATRLEVTAFTNRLSAPADGRAAVGINGDLIVTGVASVDGPVYVSGRVASSGGLAVIPVESGQPLPCDCSANRLLEIAAAVRTHGSDNDNASIGLSERALESPVSAPTLELPCGRYFFTRMTGARPVVIQARGNVALFVEGNVELDEGLQIQSDGTGSVSLFVAGEMRVRGAFSLGGDPNGPSRAGLYMAGQGTLLLGGAASIVGTLYAPRAELVNQGVLELYGHALVRRAAPAGELIIHYDTQAAEASSCP